MKKLLLSFIFSVFALASAFADATIEFASWSPKANGADWSLTAGDFTFNFSKTDKGTTNPTYNSSGKDIRIYAKGTVKITAKENMTKITLNISEAGLKRLAPITASTGTIATQKSGDKTVVWTGSAKEVTFTVGDAAKYGSDGETKGGQLGFGSVAIIGGGTAVASTEPKIDCDDTVEFSNVKQGDASFTKNINITLLNITEKFTASLSGSNVFAIDESKTDYQTKVGVKLADTSKTGSYTATLTISAAGITKNIALKVTIEAPTAVREVTIAEALEIIKGQEDKAYSTDSFVVTGKITEIATNFGTSSGRATFTLEGGLIAYNMNYLNNKTETKEAKLAVGDQVKVIGLLQKYGSKSEIVKGYIKEHTSGGSTVDQPEEMGLTTVADFLSSKDDFNRYEIEGKIVDCSAQSATDAHKGHLFDLKKYGNFELEDATGSIYIYGLLDFDGKTQNCGSLNLAAGDVIRVKGSYTSYNNLPQIKNAQIVKIVTSSVNNITVDSAKNATPYNLSGQKVSADYKGIVIRAGKKYLAK